MDVEEGSHQRKPLEWQTKPKQRKHPAEDCQILDGSRCACVSACVYLCGCGQETRKEKGEIVKTDMQQNNLEHSCVVTFPLEAAVSDLF